MRRQFLKLKTGDLPMCKFYQPYSHILRQKGSLSKLAFNKAIFTYIDRLKKTAASYKFLYLASNQVFSRQSVFVINKDFKNHHWIHQSYNNPLTYKAYINPSILKYSQQKNQVWQKCMSLPYIQTRIKRSQEIKVSYTNQNRQNIEQDIFGFKSYAYQHCMDHIQGKCVLDWKKCQGNLRVYYEVEDSFPNTKFVLKDYSMRIKQILSKEQIQKFQMKPQHKQLQKNHEDVLKKVLQDEITKFCQKYGGK